MARVTYGESITEYAGSIGGVTFLKNASGPIAKLRSNPPVNPSPDQSTHQTRMAMLVALWPTLSQGEKDSWNTIAAAHDKTTPWGETKTLSGYQWFLSTNLIRLKITATTQKTAPAWIALSPPDQFTIETSSTYIRAAWSPAFDTIFSLLAYVSLPLRQSSIKLRRSLFYIKQYYHPPALDNWDLTEEIRTLFNVTWSTFFASSDCSIIIRIMVCHAYYGWTSAFTSAIVKIG